MRRGIPVVVVVLLVALAFAAGYSLRWSAARANGQNEGAAALVQAQPSPTPVPPGPPGPGGGPPGGGTPGGRRDRGQPGLVSGTVESVRNRTLVIKVSQSRAVKADQNGLVTVDVGERADVLREIPLTEIRRGNSVTLRGVVEDGKFEVRQVIVELK